MTIITSYAPLVDKEERVTLTPDRNSCDLTRLPSDNWLHRSLIASLHK